MKILLTGASGFIGSHLAQALERSGHQVVPASRGSGVDFNNMTDTADWLPLLDCVDAVINSVGIIGESGNNTFTQLHERAPSALFRACAETGVSRVVQISALGADESAYTPYLETKKAADDTLKELPLDWFVLRPSLVYGRGGSSTTMFRRLSALPVLPLMSGGHQSVQPVHVGDVVDTVLTCLGSVQTRLTIDVVGPQAVEFRDWLQMMRHNAGKRPALVIPVPYALVLATAAIAKPFNAVLTPDNIRMLQAGSVADAGPLIRFLGHPPLDIEAGWELS